MQALQRLKRLLILAHFFAVLLVLNVAAPCEGEEKTITQIFKEQSGAVIVVYNIGPENQVQGFGSGVFLKQNGIFVTNFHVIKGAAAVSIKLSDGREFPVTGIVALNSLLDLAILKIDAVNMPTATLGDSDKVTVGERVVAIGNPLGLENTVSEGLLSAVRKEEGVKILQISAPISQGSSGGAVFNMNGEVIGVSFALVPEGQNLNLVIPVNYIKKMLKEGKVSAFNQDALLLEEGCPVIGNRKSGIYHLPGGQFHDKMRSSRDRVCFQSEAEASRAGFRRSKR